MVTCSSEITNWGALLSCSHEVGTIGETEDDAPRCVNDELQRHFAHLCDCRIPFRIVSRDRDDTLARRDAMFCRRSQLRSAGHILPFSRPWLNKDIQPFVLGLTSAVGAVCDRHIPNRYDCLNHERRNTHVQLLLVLFRDLGP